MREMVEELRVRRDEDRATGRSWPAYAVLVVFPLVLFWGVLFGHTQSFFVLFDNVQQFYPWYQKLAQAVHHGYLPLWDANAYGGHSFVGEFQAGTFYPLNLLLVLIFGSATGINIGWLEGLIACHFFLASAGMYALLRQWGLSRCAGLGGALVFAYAGAVAYRAAAQTSIFFGLCLAPWALYFLTRHTLTGKRRYLAACGAIVGLQVLAGHMQPCVHTLIMVGFYILFETMQQEIGGWEWISGLTRHALWIGGAMVLVCWPQIVLSVQYMRHAYRWVGAVEPIGPGQPVPFEVFATKYSVPPMGLLQNFLDAARYPILDCNNVYIGLLPLVLLAFLYTRREGCAATMAWRRYRFLLLTLAVFAVLAMLGSATFFPHLLHRVPVVSAVRELGRYAIIFHVALAVAVAMAIHALQFGPRLRGREKWMPVLLLVLAGAGELAYGTWVNTTLFSRGFLLQAWLALAFLALTVILRRHREILAWTAVVLIAGSVALNSASFAPPIAADKYAPNQFARNSIITYLEGFYGRYRVDVDGLALPPNVGDVYRIQTKMGHDATIYKPYFDFIILDFSNDSVINDLLNVRFIVTTQALNLPLVMEEHGVKLYERKNWYPRVFFQSQWAIPGRDIEKANRIEKLSYRDMKESYRITIDRPERVIFSEVYYPGWTAYLDGQRVPIEQPTLPGLPPVFRAVDVPAGTHVVTFYYLWPLPR